MEDSQIVELYWRRSGASPPNRLAQKMSRLRRSLKHTLEKEGFAL